MSSTPNALAFDLHNEVLNDGVHFKFWTYHRQPLAGGGGGNPERWQKVLSI